VIGRTRTGLDEMLQHFVLIGFGALLGWTAAVAYGVIGSSWEIATNDMLRFLLAILVVTFARRTYAEIGAWRSSRRPVDERLGFAQPMWETPRGSWEATGEGHGPDTEAPQPPQ